MTTCRIKSGKICWWRKLLLVLSSLLIIVGLGLIAVYVKWYYTGDEIIKLPAIQVTNPGVEEQPVTETEKKDYIVAPSALRYLSIPDLAIANARILPVGLEAGSNRIASPINIFDVGWFNRSGNLGDPNRAIFLDGHNGGPTLDGVFKRLPNLLTGAELVIERGDGELFRYRVVENYSLETNQFDDEAMRGLLKPADGKETVSIMTCTGKWIQAQKTYTHRNVIRAVLIKKP